MLIRSIKPHSEDMAMLSCNEKCELVHDRSRNTPQRVEKASSPSDPRRTAKAQILTVAQNYESSLGAVP